MADLTEQPFRDNETERNRTKKLEAIRGLVKALESQVSDLETTVADHESRISTLENA